MAKRKPHRRKAVAKKRPAVKRKITRTKRVNGKPLTHPESAHYKVTDEQIADALRTTHGTVAAAARHLGVSDRVLHYRIATCEDLQAVQVEAREYRLDFAELQLQAAIGRGEAWAVCFFLKCQGKERGYVERAEVSGHIQHEHSVAIQGTVAAVAELRKDPAWVEFQRRRSVDAVAVLEHEGD